MLPIPKHLKDILQPAGTKNHELEVNGQIVCTCGSDSFKIKYVGDDEQFKNVVCHIQIGESYYLIVNAECASCKTDFLIFDAHLHGWDGYGEREHWADKEKPKGKLLLCRKCNADIFSMSVQINSKGQEDFISEGGTEYDKEDWVEAFEWIRITTHCKNCNTTINEWIDCETM
jgi:hypothetical protein